MFWLSDNDPVVAEQYQRMPLVEYYRILDNKIEQFNKIKAQRDGYNHTNRSH